LIEDVDLVQPTIADVNERGDVADLPREIRTTGYLRMAP